MLMGESIGVVFARVLERDGNVGLLGVVSDRTVDSLVEPWLHQFAQNVSPRPHHEAQLQRHRQSRRSGGATQPRSASVQRNFVPTDRYAHRSLALP